MPDLHLDPKLALRRVEFGFSAMTALGLNAREQAAAFGRNIRDESELAVEKCKIAETLDAAQTARMDKLVDAVLSARRAFGEMHKVQAWAETPDPVLGYSPKLMLQTGKEQDLDRILARLDSLPAAA